MPQITLDLTALVTIGVVPRERYSQAEISLRSFYEHTPAGIKVIYVDSNSPRSVAQALRKIGAEKGLELIRSEYYLTAQQARNIVVPRVQTKYVVFLDNDVQFTPGWLEKMIECAEETGADAVGSFPA